MSRLFSCLVLVSECNFGNGFVITVVRLNIELFHEFRSFAKRDALPEHFLGRGLGIRWKHCDLGRNAGVQTISDALDGTLRGEVVVSLFEMLGDNALCLSDSLV